MNGLYMFVLGFPLEFYKILFKARVTTHKSDWIARVLVVTVVILTLVLLGVAAASFAIWIIPYLTMVAGMLAYIQYVDDFECD